MAHLGSSWLIVALLLLALQIHLLRALIIAHLGSSWLILAHRKKNDLIAHLIWALTMAHLLLALLCPPASRPFGAAARAATHRIAGYRIAAYRIVAYRIAAYRTAAIAACRIVPYRILTYRIAA